MITLLTLLCAENIIRDVDSDKISVINILDEIKAGGFPLYMPYISILAFLSRTESSEQKIKCKIRVSNETDILREFEIEPDFMDLPRSRVVMRIFNLVIPAANVLKVSFLHNENLLGNVDIPVINIKQPIQEQLAIFGKSQQAPTDK